MPEPRVASISYIQLNKAPNFSSSYLTRGGGCAPYVEIYSNTGNQKRLKYSSYNESEDLKTYTPGSTIYFPIECFVYGEVLVEIFHLSAFYRPELMCRFEFHVGMLSKTVLNLPRSQIDNACTDKRFPPDFFIDVGFEGIVQKPRNMPEPKIAKSLSELNQSDVEKISQERSILEAYLEKWKPGDGSICFFDYEKFLKTKAEESKRKNQEQKGGWLTKRGRQFKTWKRRWFVLKDPTLAYFRKPRVLLFLNLS